MVNMSMLIDLIKEFSLNAEQLEIVNMMHENSNKMLVLVDDLLKFSRMGAAELTKETVDLYNLVKEILSGMDTSKHHIHLGKLPTIKANETACRQLFINLISNALKYSSKAEKPEIHIQCREENNVDVFIISDNGIGIDPRFIQQLFQPFKRFTSEFKGNGLGLAIVKRIVEKHGGHIDAFNNEFGGGMRFEFTLMPQKRIL
jgi:signal transduction histidine kinase